MNVNGGMVTMLTSGLSLPTPARPSRLAERGVRAVLMVALTFGGLDWWERAIETDGWPIVRTVWDDLADCESGDWLPGPSFVEGSARWDWGQDLDALPPWASTLDRGDGLSAQFHGGLQHHPDTWDWVAPMVDVEHRFAFEGSRVEQIRVARKVQELQGWNAWPVCSRHLGLEGR